MEAITKIFVFSSLFSLSMGIMLLLRKLQLTEVSYKDVGEKNIFFKMFKPLVPFFVRLNKALKIEKLLKSYMQHVDKLIVRAGGLDITPEQVIAFNQIGFLFGIFLVFLFFPYFGWLSYFFIPALTAYPYLYITDAVAKRIASIIREFPYALDLLAMGVEAGLDFNQGIMKVVEKLKEGPLKEELSILLREIRMGLTRKEALFNLMDRVNVQDVSSFCMAIIQSDALGTPLGKTLRVISEQIRTDRVYRAEQKAAQAPVKMLPILLFFFFPAVFIIIFVPIIIKNFL